jgi:hypothetical protein
MTIIPFDIDDIPAEDFLDRVCVTIGVPRGGAKLGWKTCDDKKRSAYNRLENVDDVKQAFATHARMLDSRLRKKPVFMEVANMVCLALYIALNPK